MPSILLMISEHGMMNMTDNAVQMGMFILSQEHHIHLRPKEWVSGE